MAAAMAALSSASASAKDVAMEAAVLTFPATLPTFAAAAPTLPATLPTLLAMQASLPSFSGIFGDGMLKQCIVMSMPDLAARAPPMYTFDDPVMISYIADSGGMIPPHVGFSPKSPHLALGLLLINTVRLVPSMIGPNGGKGIGGKGGGPLGGCLM
jgi:hypothetical protein